MNRSRLRMIALTIGGITLLAGLPVGALHLGRRISWFDIDRVVVTGADLIPADEVVRQSGISTDQSLFDDSAPWLEALRGHPVIEDVRISRRLPSTVEIHIREKTAVALLAGETLALATGEGEVLPVDPASAARNLPIAIVEAPDSARPQIEQRLLAETGRLAQLDPELVSAISELRVRAAEPEVIRLQHPAGEILLPMGAQPVRLAELRSVLADIARMSASAVVRPVSSSPDTPASLAAARPAPVIDLRFDGQVVVRHPLPRENS